MNDAITRDAADMPAASYWPEYEDAPVDIFKDELMEVCKSANLVLSLQMKEVAVEAFKRCVNYCDTAERRHAYREAVLMLLTQCRKAEKIPELAYFAACYALSLEMDEGKSQTAVAKEFGVTRAAVSKRVVTIRNAMSSEQVARGQKSRAAAKVYTLRQLMVGALRTKTKLNETAERTNQIWTTTESN
jgi:predicted transcriptional regulator